MFFDKLKLIIGGVITAIVFIFGFVFVRRGNKIEEQEKVIQSKDTEIKTAEKVHETEMSKQKLKEDIKEKEVVTEKKASKSKNKTQKKIYDTPDGEEYEIKV